MNGELPTNEIWLADNRTVRKPRKKSDDVANAGFSIYCFGILKKEIITAFFTTTWK